MFQLSTIPQNTVHNDNGIAVGAWLTKELNMITMYYYNRVNTFLKT